MKILPQHCDAMLSFRVDRGDVVVLQTMSNTWDVVVLQTMLNTWRTTQFNTEVRGHKQFLMRETDTSRRECLEEVLCCYHTGRRNPSAYCESHSVAQRATVFSRESYCGQCSQVQLSVGYEARYSCVGPERMQKSVCECGSKRQSSRRSGCP